MAELEELEQEDLDAQLLEVGNPVADDLPSVPSTEPKGKCSRDKYLQNLMPQVALV